MKNVEETVKRILAEQLVLGEGEIKSTSSLEDLGADSLDHVEIVLALEDEFEVYISDEEYEKITTVALAIEAVKKLVPA